MLQPRRHAQAEIERQLVFDGAQRVQRDPQVVDGRAERKGFLRSIVQHPDIDGQRRGVVGAHLRQNGVQAGPHV